jgi:hypothetical protein
MLALVVSIVRVKEHVQLMDGVHVGADDERRPGYLRLFLRVGNFDDGGASTVTRGGVAVSFHYE